MSAKTCQEFKHNARVGVWTCNRGMGHTDAHRDPVTGALWRHPHKGSKHYPYGVRIPMEVKSEKGLNKSWMENTKRQNDGTGLRMRQNAQLVRAGE
jgi:hypothetical protein